MGAAGTFLAGRNIDARMRRGCSISPSRHAAQRTSREDHMKGIGAAFTALWICGLLGGTLPAQDKGLSGNLMRSSKVIGMDVRDPTNRKLGDIQEVVFDQEQGAIAYAVLSFGGFLGIGDK